MGEKGGLSSSWGMGISRQPMREILLARNILVLSPTKLQ